MLNINFRSLDEADYHKGHLQLLEQLTIVDPEQITFMAFKQFVSNLNEKHIVCVAEDLIEKKLVASGTLFIEPKLIHAAGCVGHIEDIVVDVDYRNRHIGKNMIEHLITYAKKHGCYKVILDCSEKNVGFYEKCALSSKGHLMSHYLE